MSKRYTLSELLEEIKKQTPKFEKGQFFEVLKPLYPDVSIGENVKNISFDGEKKATKPLACSSKSKREFEKDNSPFCEFFKDNTRGDFLEIIETDGYNAVCINRSLKNEIIQEHYNDKSMRLINIKFEDIVVGNVKRVYRGINKYI
jgi:hypothetical protein